MTRHRYRQREEALEGLTVYARRLRRKVEEQAAIIEAQRADQSRLIHIVAEQTGQLMLKEISLQRKEVELEQAYAVARSATRDVHDLTATVSRFTDELFERIREVERRHAAAALPELERGWGSARPIWREMTRQ